MIRELDRGSRYEVRVAGKNHIGWGQEAIAFIETPEGAPREPPANITYRLQSPTTLVLTWEPPSAAARNGRISGYGVHFHKATEGLAIEQTIQQTRMVFASLDENQEYSFRVRAYTSRGPGPWSTRLIINTPQDVPPAPASVQAVATSESTIEVWWEEVKFFDDIIGFRVLYTQTAVEDLDLLFP